VEEVREEGEQLAVRTRFSPGILGEAVVEKRATVKRIRPEKFTIEKKKFHLGILGLTLILGIILYILMRR